MTLSEKILSAMRFGFGGHTDGTASTDPEPQPSRGAVE
jgi:hypothetical protein